VVRAEVRYGDPLRQEYRDFWILRMDDDRRSSWFEEWPYRPSGSTSATSPPRRLRLGENFLRPHARQEASTLTVFRSGSVTYALLVAGFTAISPSPEPARIVLVTVFVRALITATL